MKIIGLADASLLVNANHALAGQFVVGEMCLLAAHQRKSRLKMLETNAARDALTSKTSQLQQVMNYAADLELEVDRLRRRDQFLQREAAIHLRQVLALNQDAPTALPPPNRAESIAEACRKFEELLRDLREPGGYHPAFDQVIDIALRPLAEQAFRSQERLGGIANAHFRLDLQQEHICWFPARLRHIIDNLISNALRYSDPLKGEVRVGLTLRVSKEGYELRVTDNGLGFSDLQASGVMELFYRSAPTRAAGLGVGLAVVKLLIEQCCGTVTVTSAEGQGTNVSVLLPRYDLEDHVESPARES